MTDDTNDADCEKPLILIAAADPDMQNILYYMVHKRGFAVEEADSKKETLEKAQLLHPDIILMDLSLGGSAGFETLRALQEQDDTRRIPVVLVCDKNLGNFQRQTICQETNVKAAVEKPVYEQTLSGILHRILNASQ